MRRVDYQNRLMMRLYYPLNRITDVKNTNNPPEECFSSRPGTKSLVGSNLVRNVALCPSAKNFYLEEIPFYNN